MYHYSSSYTIDRIKVGPDYIGTGTFVRLSLLPPARPSGSATPMYNEFEPTTLELGGLPSGSLDVSARFKTVTVTISIEP
jgi:hypothetical protein